jgi:hypothetical protein
LATDLHGFETLPVFVSGHISAFFIRSSCRAESVVTEESGIIAKFPARLFEVAVLSVEGISRVKCGAIGPRD